MTDVTTVLFANDAFYIAFAGGDLEAMDALWADGVPVTCVHPGWNPLMGRDEVMDSWQAILSAEGSPDIRCLNAYARIIGETAVVLCYESIGEAYLVATNVFVFEDNTWKLAHHQAGPSQEPDEEDDDGTPPARMQ